MVGADIISSREVVKMESHGTRPFSRGQPNRRSVSGGGDGGTTGLGQNTRSHTLDVIPGLGGNSKSRSRNGRTINSVSGGSIGTSNSINNSSSNNNGQHHQNRHHYQHKHSRVVHNNPKASSSNKNNNNNNNNNNSSNNNNHSASTNPTSTQGNNNDAGTKDANNSHTNKNKTKPSRRTVSLPKAGSRLFGHAPHNPMSSSTDVCHRNNNNNNSHNGSNNMVNGKTFISSATTHSHHMSDSFVASGSNNNNSNVFPPIAAGGHVVAARLGSGEGASNLEAAVKGEPPSMSPRNPTTLAGASRPVTRGGGVAVPTSPPEVPLSRLHFLSEPTFETLQPRTPPILPHHSLVNGVAGGGAEGGARGVSGASQANGVTGMPSSNAMRNSTLSPEECSSQKQQQPFSPGSSSERAKGKFEKKVQLSVLTEGSVTPQPQASSSPRTKPGPGIDGLGGSVPATNTNNNNNGSQNNNVKHNSKDINTKARPKRDSTSTTGKSLPKIAPPEEPFSIRRKIEQFRKWHEEQYLDKLVRFEADVTGGAAAKEGLRGVSYGNTQGGNNGLVDYTKVLEGKIAAGHSANHITNGGGVSPKPHLQHFGRGPEQTWVRKHPVTTIINTGGGGGGGDVAVKSFTDTGHNVRPTSAATWKTWRDVNTSDAYKDVKKYIKDNDLMDEEREAWIKSWIDDVEKAMDEKADQGSTGQRTK